jgi:hypothetical protein
MALKATIYKADLQIADMDRHYYADHALTIARHPSETDERMMARVLAYALYAQDGIAFTKGLFDVDEPEVWVKNLVGEIPVDRPRPARRGAHPPRLQPCRTGRGVVLWQRLRGVVEADRQQAHAL